MIASTVGIPQTIASVGTFQTTGDVRMRSEPSLDGSVVTVVYNNSNVEVIVHDPAGWSQVRSGNNTGYIRSDYLKFPINNFANFRATSAVRLRASGTVNSDALVLVPEGATVEVTEHNPAGWSRARYDGKTGFIRSDFLQRGTGTVSSSGSGSSSGSSSSGSSSGTAGATMRTNGSVNLRSEPSAARNDTIIRTLSGRTSVTVIEQVTRGDQTWSKVRHNNTEGYIRSDLLSETGTASGSTIMRTTAEGVRLRAGPSTSRSVIRSLRINTSVEVTGRDGNWSRVVHNGTTGYIRSDYLSSTGSTSGSTTMRTVVAGVRVRSGASTNHSVLRQHLPINTVVTVLENLSNGWSRVRYDGIEGFIRSDLLGSGAMRVELLDWSEARPIVPINVNISVIDVRTGIRFNLRGFSRSGHIDVEPPTRADTDAILRTRNGVWSWAARPVWVTTGGRTFAAALNGMPHDVSTIRDNGMNGHLCLHFGGTVTNSKSYQQDLRNAVQEAYNSRPR